MVKRKRSVLQDHRLPFTHPNTSESSFYRHPISSILSHFNPFPSRFSGDGIDCRRPTMSQPQPQQEIIDLTEDPDSTHHGTLFGDQSSARASTNPSRDTYSRSNLSEIVNVEELDSDPEPESRRTQIRNQRGESSDIEFLSERPVTPILGPSLRTFENPQGPHSRPNNPIPHVAPPAQGPSRSAGGRWGGRSPGSWYHMRGMFGHAGNGSSVDEANYRLQRDILHGGPRVALTARARTPDEILFVNGNLRHNIALPDELNFMAQGFQMGDAAQQHAAQQPPLPTYDKPSPPRPGFTRSPTEDDALVCPNCESELGTGGDETKKQVWVVKACGHVSFDSLIAPLDSLPELTRAIRSIAASARISGRRKR